MKSTARDWQTRLRLWAALIMATFMIASMVFFSLGLVSPEAMEAYSNFMVPVWSLYPLFFLSIVVHIGLGLWKIFRRNTLKMPLWEAIQIGFGLLLPFVLLPHLMVSMALPLVFPFQANYVDTVLLTFPSVAWRYIAVALIIAVHAHIGAHAVLRMRPWYPKIRWPMIVLLVFIPLSAAIGYWKSGTELYGLLQAGQLAAEDKPHVITAEQATWLGNFDVGNAVTFVVLYIGVFSGRLLRIRNRSKRQTVEVRYGDGRSVAVLPHTTILEASRIGNIAHASICGGRGRCTTCRVRVELGAENLSPVGDREARALLRIDAPVGVRLACQAECLAGNVTVIPLLTADMAPATARSENRNSVGRDVQLAVLFADLRGFTRLSEGRFPYDVVYILNRYFEDMGKAIEDNGGVIDKFMGDGLLAYFGLDQDPRDGCRNALLACLAMAKSLDGVNEQLRSVLKEPLSVGIGIQFGDVILGALGTKDNRHLTIIGDSVNTASRLQGLNKKVGSQLIISTEVAANAGLDLSYLPLARAQVRGKTETLRIYVIRNIAEDLGKVFRNGSRAGAKLPGRSS